ncbi:hypothetical protein ACFQ10_52415 [Streptomyces indonesiensis]
MSPSSWATPSTCCLADTEIVLLVASSSFPRWPVPDLGADQAVITGSTISLTTVDTTLLDTEA